MDGRRFDDLARGVGRVMDRRGVLRSAAAGLAAALGVGRSPAGAGGCVRVGGRCGRGDRCCGEARCDRRTDRCECAPGATVCKGRCAFLGSDPANCGACGAACPEETDCCGGSCCPARQRCCGGVCTDLGADRDNCGGCTQCPEGMACCGSRCRVLASDARHCGRCGNACRPGQTCADGQCRCAPPNVMCNDGVCHDLRSDPRNCGGCGQACAANQVCRDGQCQCGAGFRACLYTSPQGARPPVICGRVDDAACSRHDECCQFSLGGGGACVHPGRCDPCRGQQCVTAADCCGGLPCLPVERPDGIGYCGGCIGRYGENCRGNADCCSADCTTHPLTGGAGCGSYRGGRCAGPRDCWKCRVNDDCDGICQDGRCRR
jgi:hypothetical protein